MSPAAAPFRLKFDLLQVFEVFFPSSSSSLRAPAFVCWLLSQDLPIVHLLWIKLFRTPTQGIFNGAKSSLTIFKVKTWHKGCTQGAECLAKCQWVKCVCPAWEFLFMLCFSLLFAAAACVWLWNFQISDSSERNFALPRAAFHSTSKHIKVFSWRLVGRQSVKNPSGIAARGRCELAATIDNGRPFEWRSTGMSHCYFIYSTPTLWQSAVITSSARSKACWHLI